MTSVESHPAIGPDLPAYDELFTLDQWAHRWPTAAEKVELARGVPIFIGQFDERDVVIAQQCYPGRRVFLTLEGRIEIHPGGPDPIKPIMPDP